MTDDDQIAAGKAAAERHAREREAERAAKRDTAYNGQVDERYGTTFVDDAPPDEPPPGVDAHHAGEWGGEDDPPDSCGDDQAGEYNPDSEQDDDDGPQDSTENAIRSRLSGLRIDREARRRLDEEQRPPIILPPITPLDVLLAQPRTPTRYRIDKVAPENGRIVLSAQYKAGKTTVVGNLIRSLVDGEPFLGRFTVNTKAGRVVLIDDELSQNMLLDWLEDQAIGNTDAVSVVSMRGKVSSFNILDDTCRDLWAQHLRELQAEYLILDCLRPVLDGAGLDENRDAGKFLVAFDALISEAGISDAAIVHHMGHANERARGDSRLQDWPDAIWRLVRESDEPDSPRYFSAYGRDVNVAEGRLTPDKSTRRLTYAPGSRDDAKVEAAQRAAVSLLAARKEAMSKNAIETELVGEHHTQKAVRDALKRAVANGFMTVAEGPRKSQMHSIASPCIECGMPVTSGNPRHLCCPSGTENLDEGLFK